MASKSSTSCRARSGARTSKGHSAMPSSCRPKATRPLSTTRITRNSAQPRSPQRPEPAASVVAPMTGGGLCGAVRDESTGEPGFALLCHCRDCQRQSGSAFAAGWRVPAAGFRVTQGEPKLYVRAADSGNEITRAFCPDCGTMLFLRVSARPDLVAIRVGTLDDPSGFHPEADIFVKSAQPWDYMNPALPKYPAYPPGQAYKPGTGEGRP